MIEAIAPISSKKRNKVEISFPFLVLQLPISYPKLVVDHANKIFRAISENTQRNFEEKREWAFEDRRRDLAKYLQKKLHPNFSLHRKVALIQ